MLEGAGNGPFWCTCCEKECELKVTDEGIGAYEFWGHQDVDVQFILSTSCCGTDYLDYDPREEEVEE